MCSIYILYIYTYYPIVSPCITPYNYGSTMGSTMGSTVIALCDTSAPNFARPRQTSPAPGRLLRRSVPNAPGRSDIAGSLLTALSSMELLLITGQS